MSALRAAGLTARYPSQPSPALSDLYLDVESGERLLLVGPNGAGKSTFIRVFAGLMHAAAGQATVFGRPPRQARQAVGVVSHATYLYDELTALENLRFYGELYGVASPRERAAALLDQVGLASQAGERVGRLSRGQQQRVAIARALLHDPVVLLLDEPDTGLDAAALGVLEQAVAGGERTVVMTTHQLSNGLRLGTRVAVLHRGRLVRDQPHVGPADAPELSSLLEQLARA